MMDRNFFRMVFLGTSALLIASCVSSDGGSSGGGGGAPPLTDSVVPIVPPVPGFWATDGFSQSINFENASDDQYFENRFEVEGEISGVGCQLDAGGNANTNNLGFRAAVERSSHGGAQAIVIHPTVSGAFASDRPCLQGNFVNFVTMSLENPSAYSELTFRAFESHIALQKGIWTDSNNNLRISFEGPSILANNQTESSFSACLMNSGGEVIEKIPFSISGFNEADSSNPSIESMDFRTFPIEEVEFIDAILAVAKAADGSKIELNRIRSEGPTCN